MISVEMTYDELDSIIEEVTTAVNDIAENNFLPKIGNHCRFCNYKDRICYKYNNSLNPEDTM